MLSYLGDYFYIWGPLRLFRYITFRSGMALVTALCIGFVIAPYFIRKLRQLKLAQGMRDASIVGKLAELHSGKKDTPTMGGLIIYISISISTILWAEPNRYVFVAMMVYSGLTLIGFLDDYFKVSQKNSKGVHSIWKLLGQGVLTLAAVSLLLSSVDTHLKMSELWVPFYKVPLMREMPILFIFIFFFFVMSGSSNAINLTDGVDGLAIGCTISVAIAYAMMAYISGNMILSDYLFLSYVPGTSELTVVCASLVGAGLVFLWYNSYPASVFMGDTGSLALGGLIGAVAFMVHQPFTLVIVGGIFVMEALSVILQILSFKLWKKRIFRMAPWHHHFELKGWHESKVIIRFWIMSLLFALAGLSTLKLR